MKEYKTVRIKPSKGYLDEIESVLNNMASEGWELHTCDQNMRFFILERNKTS